MAQCALGKCYIMEDRFADHRKEAVSWFRKAAAQGDNEAQYWLGVCYATSNGAEKDMKQAMYRFGEAYASGDSELRMEIYRLITFVTLDDMYQKDTQHIASSFKRLISKIHGSVSVDGVELEEIGEVCTFDDSMNLGEKLDNVSRVDYIVHVTWSKWWIHTHHTYFIVSQLYNKNGTTKEVRVSLLRSTGATRQDTQEAINEWCKTFAPALQAISQGVASAILTHTTKIIGMEVD